MKLKLSSSCLRGGLHFRAVPVLLSIVLLVGFRPTSAQGFIADPEKDLPNLDKLEIFQPGEPSILYADHDDPFASLAPEYRIFVPLSRIPKLLQQAVLDVEDAQFYRHGAISLKGMARAAIRNLTSAKVKEGGSTITQQLAKSLFLSPERTLSRKVKEIQLAREIERRYSKDKILEMYLNTIYFGGGSYGIEAAARTYFNKSVGQLSLAEAALLAGLPKAPSLYSPFTDLKRARERRDHVLSRMEKEGHITVAQARAAARLPVSLSPFFKVRGVGPYFVDFVRKELEAKYGRVLLARGGLRVYTGLNLEIQRAAVDILRNGVKGIEKAQAAKRKGPAADQPGLEGALVALDPATGDIRVMVGGLEYGHSQFNRAAQARRQPGSAFKPFVYAAAFDVGLTPTTIMEDYPISYSIPQNGRMVEWNPVNYDRQFRGPVTLRRALEESINIPTVRLLEAVGIDPVISLAHRMGIKSELRREYALALGVSEVTLLEIVSAYGVLANGGVYVPPRAVRRVVAPNGDVLEMVRAEPERVLREEVAFQVTSVLEGAVERGTAKRARIRGRELAAKTGTSQDAADLWLVGYTPRLVVGVWTGFDQPQSLGSHETAGRLVAPIWADFMRQALDDSPPETVPIPEGVLPVRVNWRTGQPTSAEDPEGITEYFIRGYTPSPETPQPEGPAGEPNTPPAAAPPDPLLPPAPQPIAPLPNGAGQR
ncbi:MAG TPA: PBP1A family penicillin-binding protein [Candidatus Methylomirabilis sp.]|nr:PBP1A family penicillin-binding protein [Candidatus Methylomirabilis sp.]